MTYKTEATALIRQYGTQDEIERLDAGFLPEDEFELIVGDILFEPIADLPTRKKWHKHSIRDLAIERGKATPEDEVVFEMVEDADALNAAQWKRLKRIRQEMPKAKVSAFWIVAVCGSYEQKHPVARVEVTLGDKKRSRDVYLDPRSDRQQSDRDDAKEVLGLEG